LIKFRRLLLFEQYQFRYVLKSVKKKTMSYNLLKGKRGLIFGALNESSIAWKTAERVYEEGGVFVLSNTMASMKLGNVSDLANKCNTIVIPADATDVQDLENLITKGME